MGELCVGSPQRGRRGARVVVSSAVHHLVHRRARHHDGSLPQDLSAFSNDGSADVTAAFRLPPPAGLLIDRERPLSFRFEAQSYQGYQGDTIASALAANGVALLSRSFKYHRARGLIGATGLDGNTLVQLEGEPNVPADRRPLKEGLEVFGQHYRGSLARDRDSYL